MHKRQIQKSSRDHSLILSPVRSSQSSSNNNSFLNQVYHQPKQTQSKFNQNLSPRKSPLANSPKYALNTSTSPITFEEEDLKGIPDNFQLDYEMNQERPFEHIDELAVKVNIRKVYKLEKIIGNGYYGVVRIASRINDTTRKFACKTMAKQNIKRQVAILENEILNLQQCDHPNILRLYEVFSDHQNIHLVTELCTGGEIYAKLFKYGAFSEQQAVAYLIQILSAVRHMHDKNICHRDLKLENVLLVDNQDTSDSIIKLIDFGFSIKLGQESDQIMHALVGTPQYLAPEVINGNYSNKCDVWSIGVMMHFMLLGAAPFYGNDEDILDVIQNQHINFMNNHHYAMLSYNARDLLTRMLTKDPNRRPTIKECQAHPWMALKEEKIPSDIIFD